MSPALATEEAAEARRGRGGREHSWRNYGTKRLPFGSDVDVPGGSWGVGGQPSQQQRRMQQQQQAPAQPPRAPGDGYPQATGRSHGAAAKAVYQRQTGTWFKPVPQPRARPFRPDVPYGVDAS